MINYQTIIESTDAMITRNLNAPEFAVWCLTGNIIRMRGRRDHAEKIINGLVVDKDIPTEAIKQLNSIKNIEVRASCQGDEECPTFVIFRLREKFDFYDYNKRIMNCINKKLTFGKCCIGYGRQGFVRICIAADRKQLKSKFNLWWKKLPGIIEECLQNVT